MKVACEKGHRVVTGKPRPYCEQSAAEGWLAKTTVCASTDAEDFLAYLREVLCPALRPGQIVVMDNLAAHKVQGVAEALTAVGAELLYRSPCSPHFNPIEPTWFVVKQCLLKLKARSLAALDDAIPIAIARVSKQTVANCFRNCGYALP